MAARPRQRKHAHYPPNLHEPRPGYFTWRNPMDGRTHVIGRIPLAQAIQEANEANLKAEELAPRKTLAERLSIAPETVAVLLEKMPAPTAKNTVITRRYQDKIIREKLGAIACADLTTKHISELLEELKGAGKMRAAKMVRDRLIAVCAKGAALGWMASNPAQITEKVKAPTRRQRLGLETFNAILEKAPQVAPWLENAMLLALVSGQDRSTVGRWPRSSTRGGIAIVKRSKTHVTMEIPVALRLEAVGLSLDEVISRCKATGIVSKYLIHHMSDRGNVARGAAISLGTISSAFADARKLAGIEGDDAPTFHEIRSLSKRLYDAQGNVDTKALLGHLTERMSEMYANSRGLEPIRVRINAA
ncbi:hypothetical protein FSO04_24380 [Paraburkholderia madseniana]|uniref:Uncharacterized protein n=1 Tax=Paraburkholderia madseniana TaxID=2599607 RepID=A0A6N6WCX9_9BURK|nr:phage integrase Arm DNA-binding domain-containing protein [Paraburkholderia madseniana]KAE8757360.1 hypothetical protein FSO04_24380 [Paraburkholderia madseniana]